MPDIETMLDDLGRGIYPISNHIRRQIFFGFVKILLDWYHPAKFNYLPISDGWSFRHYTRSQKKSMFDEQLDQVELIEHRLCPIRIGTISIGLITYCPCHNIFYGNII